MVDLPNSRPASAFNAVPSHVKRSWSANKLNQSKSNAGLPTEKLETSNNFKFTTLTETKPQPSKPPRFFSAQQSKLPPVNASSRINF